ncbi:Rhombotarget lipoprotein [Gammaproteobacteria bacterium]
MKYFLIGLLFLFGGCASIFSQRQDQHAGSAIDYLYPNSKQPVQLIAESVTHLKVPVRVGIAFAPPSTGWANGPPEDEKMKMLHEVKEAFSKYEFIGAIEVIPSTYLRPKGGFSNLEQAARMFNVDIVALLSYDQMQFTDSNSLSFLYWTIIGAYIIHGDQYDIHTMLDASIFDVQSHKLLFRAPGIANVKGSAALANFSEKSRAARTEGFNIALQDLIPNLQKELVLFKEKVRSDNRFQIENRQGYAGGGDLGFLGILVSIFLFGLYRAQRR